MKVMISIAEDNEDYSKVTNAFNKATGSKFKPEAYQGWLEGDAEDYSQVEKFDGAVKKFMGKKLFEAADNLARCDAVFQQMLFPKDKVNGGGINLKGLIKEYK